MAITINKTLNGVLFDQSKYLYLYKHLYPNEKVNLCGKYQERVDKHPIFQPTNNALHHCITYTFPAVVWKTVLPSRSQHM